MVGDDFWELVSRLSKQVVEEENCVLHIEIYRDCTLVQLIPLAAWNDEGEDDEYL